MNEMKLRCLSAGNLYLAKFDFKVVLLFFFSYIAFPFSTARNFNYQILKK